MSSKEGELGGLKGKLGCFIKNEMVALVVATGKEGLLFKFAVKLIF